MIYISDYQNLNSLVSQQRRVGLRKTLSSLVGRVVTVYTDSGGPLNRGFTGLLLKVEADTVRLSVPLGRTLRPGQRVFAVTIEIGHITALSYGEI